MQFIIYYVYDAPSPAMQCLFSVELLCFHHILQFHLEKIKNKKRNNLHKQFITVKFGF